MAATGALFAALAELPRWREQVQELRAALRWPLDPSPVEPTLSGSAVRAPGKLQAHGEAPAEATCSLDGTHRMPTWALERHESRCLLVRQGIDPARVVLLPSAAFAYQRCPGVVSFDGATLQALPQPEQPEPAPEPEPEPGPGAPRAVPTAAFLAPREPAPLAALDDVLVDEGPAPDSASVLAPGPAAPAPAPASRTELRALLSTWARTGIPASHRALALEHADREEAAGWVLGAAGRCGAAHVFREAADAELVTAVAWATNDALHLQQQMAPLFGPKTRNFVIGFWRHLAQQIGEATLPAEAPAADRVPEPAADAEAEPARRSSLAGAAARHAALVAYNRRRYEEATRGAEAAGASDRALQYDALVQRAAAARAERGFEHVAAAAISDEALGLVRAKPAPRPKSALELLQEQRDYKRRRQSYRAKNTHITKRTPVQVSRDIIALRMDELFPALRQAQAQAQAQAALAAAEGARDERRKDREVEAARSGDRDRDGDRGRGRDRDQDRDSRAPQHLREDGGRHREHQRRRDDQAERGDARDSGAREREWERERERTHKDRDRERARDREHERDRDRDREREGHRGRERDEERGRHSSSTASARSSSSSAASSRSSDRSSASPSRDRERRR